MFAYYKYTGSLDLSSLNTSKVESFRSIFADFKGSSLDLSNWDLTGLTTTYTQGVWGHPFGHHNWEVDFDGVNQILYCNHPSGSIFDESCSTPPPSATVQVENLNQTSHSVSLNARNSIIKDGFIYTSGGGGVFKTSLSTMDTTQISTVESSRLFLHSSGDLFASYASNGITYRSDSNGENWARIPVRGIFYADYNGTTYASTLLQKAFKSTDNGATWTQLPGWPSTQYSFMVCVNQNNGDLYLGASLFQQEE